VRERGFDQIGEHIAPVTVTLAQSESTRASLIRCCPHLQVDAPQTAASLKLLDHDRPAVRSSPVHSSTSCGLPRSSDYCRSPSAIFSSSASVDFALLDVIRLRVPIRR